MPSMKLPLVVISEKRVGVELMMYSNSADASIYGSRDKWYVWPTYTSHIATGKDPPGPARQDAADEGVADCEELELDVVGATPAREEPGVDCEKGVWLARVLETERLDEGSTVK